MANNETIWAIVFPDGRILADSDFKDEMDAWIVALGWPEKGEIEQAKQRGYKAIQVLLLVPFEDTLTKEVKDRREQLWVALQSQKSRRQPANSADPREKA